MSATLTQPAQHTSAGEGQPLLPTSEGRSTPGALVISLDFELYWGVRDRFPLDAAERRRLEKARDMVPRILALFSEFSIHATWATVGALFASSREEADSFTPTVQPTYADARLNPYSERIGASEGDDPFHFAPSLIRQIAETPDQEIASHSYSHYYCLEPGQTAEAFEADMQSALAIARHSGYNIRSYVFPRNQVNASYLPLLQKYGIDAYRGAGNVEANKADSFAVQRRPYKRALRLLDAYIDVCGRQVAPWTPADPLACMLPSRYLRPTSSYLRPFDRLKLTRIRNQLKAAAELGQIFHLWWHPEDFAAGGQPNISFLREILTAFCELRVMHAMKSLTMAEAVHPQYSTCQ
jgi:peptidoglycan/xylan/chitin deacetylase (PgdA/CDA1 family)